MSEFNPVVISGDCLKVLRSMPDNHVHAIVTDPPYGLSAHKPETLVTALTAWVNGDRERVPNGKGFMGKEWDAFVPPPAVFDECLRVLKPGGHLVVFAGSRTVDLMGLSIRLAEFEIRDTLQWLYGTGFPKSHNVHKSTGDDRFKGWGTALKPAAEPIILARKPFESTVASNVLEFGTGALNIDATRVPGVPPSVPQPTFGVKAEGAGTFNYRAGEGRNGQMSQSTQGRFPANVLLSHGDCTDSVCQPWCPVTELGEESRFFPTFRYQAKAPKSERPKVDGVSHPTVKPLELMRWLVRLVTPPGGTVLDPFAGSGTTLQAARVEGFDSIGIEREEAYMPLISQRLEAA